MPRNRMKEYYCEYYFTSEDTITDRIKSLLSKIKERKNILRLVFFGETTNEKYEAELTVILELVRVHFGANYPLVSYIAQPVLGTAEFSMEVHYMDETLRTLESQFKTWEGVRYLVLRSELHKTVMIGGVRGGTLAASVRDQSDEIFRKIGAVLKQEGFEINHITRQWNYIGEITEFEGEVQNYQAFNDSRSLFYDQTNWEMTGYPAATGIGMSCAGVIVDLIATRLLSDSAEVKAIDNPLQIAAHSYSQEVLFGKEDERLNHRSTPKFERAKTICSDDGYTCFISGTAAIRGEASLENTNIRRQTLLTIENINYLISHDNHRKQGIELQKEAGIACVRVYVKNPEDYEHVRKEVSHHWKQIPALYVNADVCRDELLVEIEGVASVLYRRRI